MYRNKTDKKHAIFDVKIKSKIHPSIYHTAQVDLHCYEQMPSERTLSDQKKSKTGIKTNKYK